MPGKVTLRAVTAGNWRRIASLEVRENQYDFVESNAWSIAESRFNTSAVLRAIYAGETPVGFLMWESQAGEGVARDYFISRFMIDREYQSRGYGREAMRQALAKIRRDRNLNRVIICYVPENEAARDFYASFGFRETGTDGEGETIAEILSGE